MAMAVGAFTLMDACVKTLSQRYPPLQVAALRGLTALPVTLVWVGASGGFAQLVRVRLPFHLLRGALTVLMLALFAYGVRSVPLSEAYAIFFIAPVMITVLAAVFLREQVGWRRWLAIAGGLGGVLIVLRPTGAGAFSLPGLAIVGMAFCYALCAITVRILGRTDSTQSMVFWIMVVVAVGGGLAALPEWRAVEAADWRVLLALAVTGSLGQWALTEAFKLGEASVIAPLDYTAIVWTVGLDWLVWQAMPSGRTLAGAVVIIVCGVYLIRSDSRGLTARGFLANVFQGWDYSKGTLERYLAEIASSGAIVGDDDSDDMARQIAREWKADPAVHPLDPRLKVLLIREMLDGIVVRADQECILLLLEGSSGPDLAAMIGPGPSQITFPEIESEFGVLRSRLSAFEREALGKLPEIAAPPERGEPRLAR